MSRGTKASGHFGLALYRYRLLGGLTQQRAAYEAGIDQAQWSHYESGQKRPEPPMFERMVTVLDLDRHVYEQWVEAIMKDVEEEAYRESS